MQLILQKAFCKMSKKVELTIDNVFSVKLLEILGSPDQDKEDSFVLVLKKGRELFLIFNKTGPFPQRRECISYSYRKLKEN